MHGRHATWPFCTPVADVDFVKAHIHSFPRYVSHYAREDNPSQEFLPPGLTISKLYSLCCLHCEDNEMQPVKQSHYRPIFVRTSSSPSCTHVVTRAADVTAFMSKLPVNRIQRHMFLCKSNGRLTRLQQRLLMQRPVLTGNKAVLNHTMCSSCTLTCRKSCPPPKSQLRMCTIAGSCGCTILGYIQALTTHGCVCRLSMKLAKVLMRSPPAC